MINVGLILHTPETFDLLKGGKRINVGQFIEANPEARVLLSPTTFTDEYFSQQETRLDLLAFGPVMVDWETTPEAIEKGLASLDIFGGPLICPRHLVGILQSKIQHQKADTVVYESASARFVMGKLVLDQGYLDSMVDGSELIVVGALKIPEVVPDDLFKQKVNRLYVEGRFTCHEENASTIQAIIDATKHKAKIIPTGYTLVEKPLVLNNLALESLRTRKIYCTEWVRIDQDVTSDTLDKNLDALISDERIFCPVGLKDVIVKKCDWLKTSVELFEGELWVIEDARELPSYAFEHLEGLATLVVFGELKLGPQVRPEILSERLDKVHNLGSISCTPEQIGAIQALLGVNEGRLSDSSQPQKEKKEEPDEGVIQESYINANYVSL